MARKRSITIHNPPNYLIALGLDSVQRQWFFTFGFGHKHPDTDEPLADCFVRVVAKTHTEAREKMVARFGRQWAMQYETEADAGVEEFQLRQIAVL